MKNLLGNLNNTQKGLLVTIMAIILYVVSASITYSLFSQDGTATNNTASVPNTTTNEKGEIVMVDEDAKDPKTESCPLNGAMKSKRAKEAWEKRRPLAVMIENHEESRPQSGLTRADVVYEAIAEGGITRFMGVFYCQFSDVQVGPVRSARTYFIDWLSEYDALYAHVGGANTPGPANALGQIIDYGIKDLNQFSIGFPTFWRDYQRLGHPVATEHTMYSTIQKLWEVGAKRGWTNINEKGVKWDANFVPWKFKDGAPGGTTATKINVPYWGGNDYVVQWTYDKACNCYKRANGGEAHIDLDYQEQLSPTNIVVQFERESRANDGYEGNVHLLYGTIGKGKALIFQDGKVIEGTWNKPKRTARTQYLDQDGKEINFVKGQIWVQTVPDGNNVTYN